MALHEINEFVPGASVEVLPQVKFGYAVRADTGEYHVMMVIDGRPFAMTPELACELATALVNTVERIVALQNARDS